MRIRLALAVLGVAMMLFGVISAIIGPHFNAVRQPLFLAAALVLHDGVLLPFFLLIGALVARFVPAHSRAIVQGRVDRDRRRDDRCPAVHARLRPYGRRPVRLAAQLRRRLRAGHRRGVVDRHRGDQSAPTSEPAGCRRRTMSFIEHTPR